ncbi:MAG: cache domain-containing protein [Methanolinea sp.]|nr:cache domain-containing protein [Methanolinea sp.]
MQDPGSQRMRGFLLFALVTALLLVAAGCTAPSPPVSQVTVQTPTPASALTGKDTATRAEMVAFVKEAVQYARTEGRERALAEFDTRDGSFFRGVLYIYAYDLSGTTIAHPVNPEKIGVNRLSETDARGNLFIRDLRDTVVAEGKGFVRYYYINPVHGNAVEAKLGYVETVDGEWWLGSGIYDDDSIPLVEGVPDRLVMSVRHAKAYAILNGRDAALMAFNDRNGSFVRGNEYIFANDYNGTTLAWPYRPDLVGTNRFNATDPQGFPHLQAMIAAARNGSGVVSYISPDPSRNNTPANKTSYVMDIEGTWFLGSGVYERG